MSTLTNKATKAAVLGAPFIAAGLAITASALKPPPPESLTDIKRVVMGYDHRVYGIQGGTGGPFGSYCYITAYRIGPSGNWHEVPLTVEPLSPDFDRKALTGVCRPNQTKAISDDPILKALSLIEGISSAIVGLGTVLSPCASLLVKREKKLSPKVAKAAAGADD